jgi:hypothetical protein
MITMMFGLESFEGFASATSAKPVEAVRRSVRAIVLFIFSPCFVSEDSPSECQIPNVAAFARAWNAFRHSCGLQRGPPSGERGYAKQRDAASLVMTQPA